MKKNFLAMATLACGLLTFSACSSDDDNLGGGQTGAATGELCDVTVNFDFEVSSASSTRAGRPLYSQEALQQVNDMHLYLFKEVGSDYVFQKEIIDANGFGFNDDAVTGTETKTYTLTDKLETGRYKFLAVGFEEKTNAEASSTTYTPLAFTAHTTKLDEAKLALAGGKTADEVFSGVSGDVDVKTDNATFNVGVTLNRTVAGILGYFKNIPTTVGGQDVKHVVVKVVKKSTSAKLVDRSAIGEVTDGYNIIDIDLSHATTGKNDAGHDIFTSDGNQYSENGVTVVENSFLKGAYSLPLAVQTGEATLVVALTGADTNSALKTYNVKVKGVDGAGAPGEAVTEFAENTTAFPLVANYFYSIGKKLKNNTTGGGGDDEDDPIDLTVEQEIVISVAADWAHRIDLGLVID